MYLCMHDQLSMFCGLSGSSVSPSIKRNVRHLAPGNEGSVGPGWDLLYRPHVEAGDRVQMGCTGTDCNVSQCMYLCVVMHLLCYRALSYAV